jgi:hypothetical protein
MMMRNNRYGLGILHSFVILLFLPNYTLADNSATKLSSTDHLSAISRFDVVYSADFNGFNVEAKHQLIQLENGSYKEILQAKNMLGKIYEHAIFDISTDGQIIPQEHIKRKKIFGSRTEKQLFDWTTNSLTYSRDGKSQQIEIQPGFLDVMSHKLQLREDIANGKENLSYTVISKGKLKQYQYRVAGHQVLETPLGPLNTVVIERVTESKSKYTRIWLASDWDYLIVRLKKDDQGKTQEMLITNGTLNNSSIRPLKIDIEN